ncbi:MAG: hypothetical protein M9905_06075 [Rhizobiaceae bacterium]|nr:hypothetical protein [Rhizobiaceae bacterium]
MLSEPTLYCRVCGLEQAEPQYGKDGVSPTFDICPCCGVEFGYQDTIRDAVLKFRDEWLASGAKWAEPKKQPTNWDLPKQLSQVPEQFK